jgi:hypothetical protein
MYDTTLIGKISEPTLPVMLLHRTDLLAQLQEALAPVQSSN